MKQVNYVFLVTMLYLPMHTVNAQSWTQGEIYWSDGDTIVGLIKVPGAMGEVKMYHELKFKDVNNTKRTFYPEHLRGYKVNGDCFETVTLGQKNQKMYFMKVLVRGYCTLYEYKYYDSVYMPNGGGMSRIATSNYFKRDGESATRARWLRLSTGYFKYFKDNPELSADLKEGKYRRKDLKEIVKRYNQEYAEQQRESKIAN